MRNVVRIYEMQVRKSDNMKILKKHGEDGQLKNERIVHSLQLFLQENTQETLDFLYNELLNCKLIVPIAGRSFFKWDEFKFITDVNDTGEHALLVFTDTNAFNNWATKKSKYIILNSSFVFNMVEQYGIKGIVINPKNTYHYTLSPAEIEVLGNGLIPNLKIKPGQVKFRLPSQMPAVADVPFLWPSGIPREALVNTMKKYKEIIKAYGFFITYDKKSIHPCIGVKISSPVEPELLEQMMTDLTSSISNHLKCDEYMDFLPLRDDSFLKDYNNIEVIYQRGF